MIRLLKQLIFIPLLAVFNLVILIPALLVILARKIDKQAIALDKEVTASLYKIFRQK